MVMTTTCLITYLNTWMEPLDEAVAILLLTWQKDPALICPSWWLYVILGLLATVLASIRLTSHSLVEPSLEKEANMELSGSSCNLEYVK